METKELMQNEVTAVEEVTVEKKGFLTTIKEHPTTKKVVTVGKKVGKVVLLVGAGVLLDRFAIGRKKANSDAEEACIDAEFEILEDSQEYSEITE